MNAVRCCCGNCASTLAPYVLYVRPASSTYSICVCEDPPPPPHENQCSCPCYLMPVSLVHTTYSATDLCGFSLMECLKKHRLSIEK